MVLLSRIRWRRATELIDQHGQRPLMRTGNHSQSANTANLGDELVSRCGIVFKLIGRFSACRREQLLFKVHHKEPSFGNGPDRFKRSDMCAIQAAKAFAALQTHGASGWPLPYPPAEVASSATAGKRPTVAGAKGDTSHDPPMSDIGGPAGYEVLG